MGRKKAGTPKKLQHRYFPRMEVEVLLAYRPLGSPKEDEKIVKSTTLGIGGLMFETDRPMDPGAGYLLDLVLGESRLEVRAEVVYSNPSGSGLFQTGFTFVEMEEQQRDLLTSYFLQEYEKAPHDVP